MITARTQVLGLVGKGTTFSLSPQIHNFAARYLDKDYCYVHFELNEAAQLDRAIASLWSLGVVGLNITTPYKNAVAEYLGLKEPVNVLIREPSGWRGASTDAEGFERSLTRLGFRLSEFRKVVIMGDGGAAQSLLGYLSSRTTCDIHVLRRSARTLPISSVSWHPFEPRELKILARGAQKDTLIVQATSAPLRGEDLHRFVEAIEDFRGVFVDMIYGTPSKLLERAKVLGIPHQDGLGMLIEQARLCQELWWGEAAPYEDIEKHLCSQRISNNLP